MWWIGMKIQLHIKSYILLFVAALGLVGSFFLPNVVAAVVDSRRLDNVITVEAQSISISADPILDLSQRIALVASPNTEMLALTTGRAMGIEMAETRAKRELARLFRGSIFGFEAEDCVVEDYSILFAIDAKDPTANIIVWEFKIVDSISNEVLVSIDDETGSILKLIYQLGNDGVFPAGSDDEKPDGLAEDGIYSTALQLTKMMTEYYGKPVELGDYVLSGNIAYYRGDMYDAGGVISMYGVVRANSFTMNERV